MEVDTSSGLNEQLADAARTLQAETSAQRTLERCVALATELIDGCDYAGISFVRRKGPIETPAATDPLVLRGDKLQYSLQEGPCLDAIWDYETVHSPNLATEQRWPRWAPQVVDELAVASMLSFRCTQARTPSGPKPVLQENRRFRRGRLQRRDAACCPGCCRPGGVLGYRAMAECRPEPDHHRSGGGDLDGTLRSDG